MKNIIQELSVMKKILLLFLFFCATPVICCASESIKIDLSSQIMSESAIRGMYKIFKEEYRVFSPVHGALALPLVANYRFKGNYGKMTQDFLCHYQISKSMIIASDGIDAPLDNTSSILQQLFPSPAGGFLALPGALHDLFRKLPFDKLADLLILYVNVKNKPLNERSVPLQDWFSKCFDGGLNEKKASAIWLKMRNSWGKKELSTEKFKIYITTAYAKIFAGAADEQKHYAQNLVESALLGFMWMRAQKQTDLNPYFKKMAENGYLQGEWKWGDLFTQQDYITKKVYTEDFEQLTKDPEKLIFNVLAVKSYGAIFPPTLGTGISYQLLEKGEKKFFSDCGDALICALLNLLLGDEETKTFDLDFLKLAFPNASPELIRYYKEVQPSFAFVNGGQNTRAAFSKVLSTVNKGSFTRRVNFRDKEYNFQLCPGFDNSLLAISRLLGDEDTCPLPKQSQTEDSARAEGFSYTLGKI